MIFQIGIAIATNGVNGTYYSFKKLSKDTLLENNAICSINNNTELKTKATSGSGTLIQPYILSVANINCNNNNNLLGVVIQNTDKYFVLSNFWVSGCTNGIYLDNVSNALIINASASFNWYGFLFNNSRNNLLENSSASNNGYDFGIISSVNSTLKNNIAFNSYLDGFYILDSSVNKLTTNEATNNSVIGFEVSNCNDTMFK